MAFHLKIDVQPEVLLVILAVALLGVWRCCRRNEPNLPPVVEVQGFQIPVDQLIQTKDPRTAYLLLFAAGLVGCHHFYLDRLLHGCLAAITGNFLGVGWLLDLFCIPYYTSSFNRTAAPGAPRDRSCGRLTCYLPLVVCVAVCTLFTVVLGLPSVVHSTGLMDLEQRMAGPGEQVEGLVGLHTLVQNFNILHFPIYGYRFAENPQFLTKQPFASGTGGNPYVILEIDREANPEEIQKAYDAQLREVESSQDCRAEKNSKACKRKKKDLKKALDFAMKKQGKSTTGTTGAGTSRDSAKERRAKRRAKSKDEDSIDQWFDQRREEWDAFFEEVREGTAGIFKRDQRDKAASEEL
eukprot:s1107_g12.t1